MHPRWNLLDRPAGRCLAGRLSLVALALIILVMPALDLGWNEPKLAGHPGVPCPLHANPVVDLCPAATDVGLTSESPEIVDPPLRLQLFDASIFTPPKL